MHWPRTRWTAGSRSCRCLSPSFYLLPRFGELRLDTIPNAKVAKLKAELVDRSPKTVNNVLVVLNMVFKTALKWGVIEQMPATIELLKVAPATMEFYEPYEFERLVDAAARVDHQHLVFILLGGEAGLRCGEIIALEQTDVDLTRASSTFAARSGTGTSPCPRADGPGR
ncbi:hypothetical protein D7X74_29445 [Corallococcus sp. CA047B]|uniref:hypothetical protein n=1 Tax=Corallococcus sp. CA047B TaxID=2316729 RepID=UPI000EA3A39E|nr:hypothetical protein [Corallococcus sp. CA047B]RKH09523.1 hypothetical protein D7X74_29445 [Corallococcus sp. CA047B]